MKSEVEGNVDGNVPKNANEDVDKNVNEDVDSGLDGEVAREILRGCVFSRTRMLDRVLSRLFDDSLSPLGVRANQLTVLALIGAMEGLRAADVAQYLEMDKSTVSRGLALLRDRGWVAESVGATKTSRRLVVTAEGRALLHETLPFWRSAVEKACDTLGEESVEALRGAADSFLRLRASHLFSSAAMPLQETHESV